MIFGWLLVIALVSLSRSLKVLLAFAVDHQVSYIKTLILWDFKSVLPWVNDHFNNHS
jgi:hypothetical protein